MGMYNLDNPARCGGDVAQFDGWAMANIIRKFVDNGLDTEYARTQFRRAILVSSEFRAVSKGARFGV